MTEGVPQKIGKYEIRGPLGEGAMGLVLEGYDPIIRRRVAIKVIRKALLEAATAQSILDRFRMEAQAAGGLHHPNIVSIYEYGEDGDFAFIAMECVTGKSLRQHLHEGYRPELKQFPEIIDQILEALEYSHSRGVVHRDIKPSNILIDDTGRAKISDFGIARLATSDLTKLGEVLGTPSYMSPEQFSGEAVDERTDIYAAGIIVYEVLTGTRPFVGSDAQILKQVLHDMPTPPSAVEPRLPPALDAVIFRAIAKRPEERWPSAREFADALHDAFHGGAPAAEPARAAAPPAAAEADGPTVPKVETAAPRIPAGAAALKRALAAQPRPDAPAAPAEEAKLAAPRPRLLFVDDEARILAALRALFRDKYEVDTVMSGDSAVELLRQKSFHVVVSDQRMPGMKGVELLRHLRTHSPKTVRLLLTGYSDLAAIVGSINEGEVYRFVSKPWDNEELKNIMREAAAVAVGLAKAPALPASLKLRPDATVVVFDTDERVHRATRELMAGACKVIGARNLEEALRALEAHEVAVMVANLDVQRDEIATLFKLLKQEHPQTLSIAITRASDSELVINLINQARLFRFVSKPINLPQLKAHIIAALERYESYRAAPEFVSTEKAETRAETATSSIGQRILDRLRALPGRLLSPLRSS